MNVGKIVKTEFFVYLNKELYRIVHSWEELEDTEKEIFTKYSGYNLLYGSTVDFSVYINKKTKDVLTYWFKIRRTTNLKDAEECWQEMEKHKYFGWIKGKDMNNIIWKIIMFCLVISVLGLTVSNTSQKIEIEELQATVTRQANAIQQLEKEKNNTEVTIPQYLDSLPYDD